MIVDTNTVDKTYVFPDSSVRVLLQWKNVDGVSVERVVLYGMSEGLPQPITAEWVRKEGVVKTNFSAPDQHSPAFVSKLLRIARDISFPEECRSVYEQAMADLEVKRELLPT